MPQWMTKTHGLPNIFGGGKYDEIVVLDIDGEFDSLADRFRLQG